MTSQYKKNSPKGKGQGLNLALLSKMTTKQLIVYVYGEDKGWKITPTSATSHYGVDTEPDWSPKGDKIAWFSDENRKNYQLLISNQEAVSYTHLTLPTILLV